MRTCVETAVFIESPQYGGRPTVSIGRSILDGISIATTYPRGLMEGKVPCTGTPNPPNQPLGSCILHCRIVVCADFLTNLALSRDRYSSRTTHDEASSPRSKLPLNPRRPR